MAKVKTQIDNAARAFEALAKAVENAPYNFEVEQALDDLRIELMDLGLEIYR